LAIDKPHAKQEEEEDTEMERDGKEARGGVEEDG